MSIKRKDFAVFNKTAQQPLAADCCSLPNIKKQRAEDDGPSYDEGNEVPTTMALYGGDEFALQLEARNFQD